jgi:hypothetical protein
LDLDDLAAEMVLAITDHSHGVPLQAFPRVKVGGVPDLDAIGALPELEIRPWGAEAPLRRLE